MRILVTGATGNVGRLVVDELLARRPDPSVVVRALTTNPAKAALPENVEGLEVVTGFIGKLSTMPAALEGVDTLYLAPHQATAKEVVQLAKQAGVQRIVALSSTNADEEAKGDPSEWTYYATEHAVLTEGEGLRWTFLRAGQFMWNLLDNAEQIKTTGEVRAAYGKAAFAPVDIADIAAVAAKVLLTDGHDGEKYPLIGSETVSKIDATRVIGEVLGREIPFIELSREEARQTYLAAGLDEYVADWLLDNDAMGVDYPQPPDFTIERLTGRPAKTFKQFVSENRAVFE
ncbi:NAD(P)H-binding protein [Tenggerimyces flavus]|uniref:NAD(P)H-binding protein n=1 Tax=Tenggerimyces flavus TaxID=1708749 RepID=A0ABV7Y7V4_9ACTN|nr:NAD(P)H-binding protein [Tenggerimyces flavus]MBM7788210.1 uncharacterized protein YbjT (DUF2867 family) [Tenggerimyces flavus]